MLDKPSYLESTLEVLSTFHMHRAQDLWDEPNVVHFQLMGHEYHLSYTEFIVYLGFYDHGYITTDDYRHLHSFPILGERDS